MGQSIAGMIKSIDGGDASAQETKDTLNALYALGQSRVDSAYAEAMSDRGSMYAPISKVILRRQQVVCKASQDLNGIATGIKDSVGKLMNGQILDGVVDLIQNGMNIVLGSSAGQIGSTYTYALVATDLGGLLRVDVDIYSFSLQSQGLQTKIQNMVAISSLISSINPTGLTASDIRAIISVSYGGSPIETQRAVLDLVMSAWELDRKRVEAGAAGVSEQDLADFRAKIRPSRFDALEPRVENGVAVTKSPPKVDRATLRQTFTRLQISNGADKADPFETLIRIWIKLSNPAEEMFITWLTGMMTGLSVPDIFMFKEIDAAGYSGDALSISCTIVAANSQLFDAAISYVEDTVLYCLNNSGLFTKWIGTVGVQYKYPGSDQSGFVSRISFKYNNITNNSNDTVQFVESETTNVLLKLEPGKSDILIGVVDYIISPVQSGPDEPDKDAGAQTSGSKWVTYDTIGPGKILTSMPITVQSNASGGYALSFIGPDDQQYVLLYNDAWSH